MPLFVPTQRSPPLTPSSTVTSLCRLHPPFLLWKKKKKETDHGDCWVAGGGLRMGCEQVSGQRQTVRAMAACVLVRLTQEDLTQV